MNNILEFNQSNNYKFVLKSFWIDWSTDKHGNIIKKQQPYIALENKKKFHLYHTSSN